MRKEFFEAELINLLFQIVQEASEDLMGRTKACFDV